MLKTNILTLLFFCSGHLFGQKTLPFSKQNVFIENRGQFDDVEGEKVLFKSNLNGYNVYFTATGFLYEYHEKERLTDDDKERMEEGEEIKLAYHKVEFENCKIPLISSSDYTETIFHYSKILNDNREVVSLKGAKILTYKNVYKKIDFVFSLPEEGGLKYDIRINPGGDIRSVALRYPYAEKIVKVNDMTLDVATEKGVFKSVIPKAYTLDDNPIDVVVGYELSDNTIRFSCNNYNPKDGLIIDPWETTPGGGIESVFDVDFDYQGNVYCYGSNFGLGYFVAKYNSLGVEEWVFDVTYMNSLFNGDIAVNKFNGECYVVSVVADGGTDILRLDTEGSILSEYGYIDVASVLEIWRCEYDHCSDSLILGIGGDAVFGQLATIDQDLTGPLNYKKPVVDVVGCIDVSTMAIDPNGESVFVLFPREGACAEAGVFDNRICSLALSDLSTFNWEVDSEYDLNEITEWFYGFINTNNFNGIAVGRNLIYSFDSDKLVKRDRLTGVTSGFITAGGITGLTHGITADLCDNVFVGVNDEIHVYDSTLTLITTFPLPGRCHDIQLNKRTNLLYVAGLNYVKEIDVSAVTNNFTLNSTPDNCENCDGTASLTSTCLDLDLYDILWMPSGETTAEISDLCTGYQTCFVLYGCDTLFADSVLVELTDDCGLNVTVLSDTICEGDCIELVAEVSSGTGPFSFEWGPGILDTDDTVNVCPEMTTTYQVIVVDALGESDTTEATITVVAYPMLNLGNDTTLCVGNELLLDAENIGSTYLWQDGVTDQTYTVTLPGVYWVEVNNGGCTNIDSVTVDFNGPELDLGPDTLLCEIEDFILDAENPGYFYIWQDGSVTQTLTVIDTGVYFVLVTDPESGCAASDTIIISAGTLLIDLGSDTVICAPETLTLESGITDATYLWQDGTTEETFWVSVPGIYSVFVTKGFCSGYDSIIVEFQNPIANFSAPNYVGCEPNEINFLDLSEIAEDIVEWNWNFGDGSGSSLQNPSHIFEASGTYNVNLTVITSDGCSSDTTKNIAVEIYPSPIAAFTFTPILPETDEMVIFTDLSINAESWFWDFGDGNYSTDQNPTHSYTNLSNYSVTLIVKNGICSDTVHTTIIIEEPVIFYVPNVFTPDGDSFNEVFQPVFTSGFDPYDFHLVIYNRWGEIIFESYNAAKGWNGTYGNETIVQDGVYTWVIKFGDVNSDKKYEYIGYVTLLK